VPTVEANDSLRLTSISGEGSADRTSSGRGRDRGEEQQLVHSIISSSPSESLLPTEWQLSCWAGIGDAGTEAIHSVERESLGKISGGS